MTSVRINQSGIAKIYVLLAIIAATIGLFIFGTLKNSDRGVGTGKEYKPPDGPAIMNDSEDLYRFIGNDAQFTFIRADVAAFARLSFDPYKSGEIVAVIFNVKNTASIDSDKITFGGKYSESKDDIEVTITKLPNNRLKTSITNKKTGLTIDSQLPSNSKRNQFIGMLPLKQTGYSVSYLATKDAFYVTLAGSDINRELNEAKAVIINGLGIQNLSEEGVSFVTWGANGNPISVPNPDLVAN
ncbi:hypothetical protein H0X10_03700 [Candidatus Saccharibacteria bacterium]|nr:hypothetical protein [Candidatus Saccharibacteria bacterium]